MQLFFLGLLLEVFCIGIVGLGDLRNNAARFILVYLSAFLPYFLCIYLIKGTSYRDRMALGLVVVFAIIFRITLVFSPPTLSDDIYRYLWDGKVGSQGINPYSYPPDAAEIAWLRDAYYPYINHKNIPTIYPPLTQIVFFLVAGCAQSLSLMKSAFISLDLLTMLVILKLLACKGKSPLNLLLYAWNPLILIEFSSSGHNDSLAIFFLVLSLYFVLQEREKLSIGSLSLSFLSKYLAFLFLPLFWNRVKKRALLLFPLIIFAFYLPYLDAGKNLFAALFTYAQHWRFNDSLFALLCGLTGSPTFSKVIAAALICSLATYLALKGNDLLRGCYLVIGAVLLLSPTLHPWYLTWIIPFLCFFPNRGWLLLTGLVGLSYYILIDYIASGVWQESIWIKALEFIPFYALLIFDWVSSRKSNDSSK